VSWASSSTGGLPVSEPWSGTCQCASDSIRVNEGSPPNQRLKLPGAAILVLRAATYFQAAPAAWPFRSADWRIGCMRLYRYIGPKHIAERALSSPPGTAITCGGDVLAWIKATSQQFDADGSVIATFVVDESGMLRIADRRSEHVICADGRVVRSAGEMTFALVGDRVTVIGVSNQSTGYCPEPAYWPAVAEALCAAGLAAPAGFTFLCEFRLCLACGSKHLIKDGVFVCSVCGGELPAAYNCQG
jgi:hypothetical protein